MALSYSIPQPIMLHEGVVIFAQFGRKSVNSRAKPIEARQTRQKWNEGALLGLSRDYGVEQIENDGIDLLPFLSSATYPLLYS